MVDRLFDSRAKGNGYSDRTGGFVSNASPKKGWRVLAAAFRNRKTGVMLVLGFAAGLPNTLLLSTLNAWLDDARVDLTTIGILSWIGLAYAFKFLWSPLVDRVTPPLLGRLGRRRSWLIACQVTLVMAFVMMSLTDPARAIGWFAIIAVLGAFTSATQDVVIDAWRIDVADQTATLELLSTVYQFGSRFSALVGGALALIFAARVGWPMVYGIMALVMAATIIATLLAPDTHRPPDDACGLSIEGPSAVPPRERAVALILVGLGWAWAILTIAAFMIRILASSPEAGNRPNAQEFIMFTGPWIVAATVILPALVAAWLNARTRNGSCATVPAPRGPLQRMADHAYSALIVPLGEIVARLRWGALIVLGLILTYRLCDAVWGPFAVPFYQSELHYTKDEIALASKLVGVVMTITGVALGGLLFVWLGRMPTMLIGALVAGASNLLYADLASGAVFIDGVARITGLETLGAWAGISLRMIRIMTAIAGENIAGGIASAAFVAYLSGIVSRRFSAVQYALLSSLTFLIGALGRGALGEAIEQYGYAPVFRFAAALGLVAVVFCILEWIRTRADPPSVPGGRA